MRQRGESLVRLVVQWVCESGKETPGYRVIVYPQRSQLGNPLMRISRAELLRRLSVVLPDFDESLVQNETRPPQIIFATTAELTDEAMARLFER